jgi:hypothetical protein
MTYERGAERMIVAAGLSDRELLVWFSDNAKGGSPSPVSTSRGGLAMSACPAHM